MSRLIEYFTPTPDQIAGLGAAMLVAFALIVLGAAVSRRKSLPEMNLVLGWAVVGFAYPVFAGLMDIPFRTVAIGLAICTELPLVIVDVQRGGPSTGLPTKTEQGDLMQAIYGRNSESPVAVVAPCTPSDCFFMAIEAIRLAAQHMCPVIYLSDNTLANGAEPWLLPAPATLPKIELASLPSSSEFAPYLRDSDTLARPWVPPGISGLEHRIGGLEKEDVSGEISYDPDNHEHMVRTRQAKIDRIADRIEPAEVHGDQEGELLIVGFGGTYGALHQAVNRLRDEGHRVGHMHLRYLNPLQHNVGEVLSNYQNVIVAELNGGQLAMLLRSRFLVDCQSLTKMQGVPFKVREVVEAARKILPGSAQQGVHA